MSFRSRWAAPANLQNIQILCVPCNQSKGFALGRFTDGRSSMPPVDHRHLDTAFALASAASDDGGTSAA